MEISSPHWDEKNGVCKKHWIPQLPCLSCYAEKDPDLHIVADLQDQDICHDEDIPIDDLLPSELRGFRPIHFK